MKLLLLFLILSLLIVGVGCSKQPYHIENRYIGVTIYKDDSVVLSMNKTACYKVNSAEVGKIFYQCKVN